MTTVEEFNLRLSATKDVLVGLEESQLSLVSLSDDDLRGRARALIKFLAEVESDDVPPPEWFADVAPSAEDYLFDLLRGCMPAEAMTMKASFPAGRQVGVTKAKRWWHFWR